jgi:hypothetical protein
MSNQEKVAIGEQLEEKMYQESLNQKPIKFLLHPNSAIRNDYNNSSSSEDGIGDNKKEVGMDD